MEKSLVGRRERWRHRKGEKMCDVHRQTDRVLEPVKQFRDQGKENVSPSSVCGEGIVRFRGNIGEGCIYLLSQGVRDGGTERERKLGLKMIVSVDNA